MRLLIKDAKLALKTIDNCAGREGAQAHAMASAEWLEKLARQIREELSGEGRPSQLEADRNEARASAQFWRDAAAGNFSHAAMLPWETDHAADKARGEEVAR
jgi:hypothetical protein